MPSGRWIDSILMTSAPNAASEWVADGPAQNAVKSTTRTPASGSSADRVRTRGFPWLPRGIRRRPRRAPAQARTGAWRGDRHQPRRARLPESRRVVDVDAALPQVVHLRDGRTVAERGQRQPEQLAEFDDLLDGALAHPRVDPFTDPVAVVPSPDLEPQLRNLGELGAIHHRGEVEPLLPGDHADADVAVLGRLDRRHLDRALDGRHLQQLRVQPFAALHQA